MSTKVLSRTSTSLQKLTADDSRKIAIEALRAAGQTMFKTLTNVEFNSVQELDQQPVVAGTVLEPIATAFSAATGNPVTKIGDVRGPLGMNQNQMNAAFCYCVNGREISGEDAAGRLDIATAH